MSEYQYYEFQALDRPLNQEDQAYIRQLSSRVELTSTKAQFTYHYGDFRGKPEKVLDRCFDVMFYIANFGVRRLMFRLPKALIDPAIFEPYCIPHYISVITTEKSVILNLSLVAEDYYGWIDEDDWLTDLLPLRENLLQGDFRVLYLAWLKAGFGEDVRTALEDLIEPPVPPNLKKLSPALNAFVDVFKIDTELIAVAAEASPNQQAIAEPIEDWVAALSEAERNAYLVRAVKGETHVGAELLLLLRQRFGQVLTAPETHTKRSLADLVAIATQRREQQECKAQQAAAKARQKELATLASKSDELWQTVHRLIDLKQAKAYDEAVAQILKLQEVAEYKDELEEFSDRLQLIKHQYGNRPSFLARLYQAGF